MFTNALYKELIIALKWMSNVKFSRYSDTTRLAKAFFPKQPNEERKEDSRELHVGLGNVSSRLKAICGGSLDIGKRAEGGTIAIIRIPINS